MAQSNHLLGGYRLAVFLLPPLLSSLFFSSVSPTNAILLLFSSFPLFSSPSKWLQRRGSRAFAGISLGAHYEQLSHLLRSGTRLMFTGTARSYTPSALLDYALVCVCVHAWGKRGFCFSLCCKTLHAVKLGACSQA